MTRPTATATYNPHLLSREDLVASFVARRPLLDALVDDLRRGAHQHHLLIGSRGSGKTTLLLRLAVAIEDDKKLARTALPLRFPEEQYNVARPSDFWLNCLDALADVLEARGDQKGKRKLEAAVASVEPLPEEERSEAALAALTDWAKQAGKLLVLLVDNLDLILQRLRDSQWGLREALSTDNRLVLIGGTSTFLDDAVAYESPLYDFFHVHELGPLSEEVAREVVTRLAKLTGTPHVQAALESEPGRFKALYVLTGGMPRMLGVLAGVLAADASSIDADLERMLDQMTPYYKARFDELPSQSQIIVDAVALHWHPITAATCAERTRLDVNVVSAQLNRLVKQGLLAKVSLPGAGKLGFQLTERFFNIWYLMRASRRARQKLAWFVEFLRVFYGEEELSRRAQTLLDGTPGADDPARMLALANAVNDVALRRRLELRAATMLIEQTRPDTIREFLDLDGDDAHLAPVLDRARALKKLRARMKANPDLTRIADQIIESPTIEVRAKIVSVDRLVRSEFTLAEWRAIEEMRGREISLYGAPLLTAIGRGEVPSVRDVRTPSEAAELIELAKDPLAVELALVDQLDPKEVTDELARYIEERPKFVLTAIALAKVWVRMGDWSKARGRARWALERHLQKPCDTDWGYFLMFFRDCVRHGRAREAAELLAELGLADRSLPLYEALRASNDDGARLSHVAPEVRIAAAGILEFLQQPEPAAGSPDPVPPAATKKAARKRRSPSRSR